MSIQTNYLGEGGGILNPLDNYFFHFNSSIQTYCKWKDIKHNQTIWIKKKGLLISNTFYPIPRHKNYWVFPSFYNSKEFLNYN